MPVIICREHAIHITSDASIYMTKRRVRVVMRGPEGRYPNKVFDIDLKSGTVEESLNANEPNPKWTKLRGPMA